MTERATAALGEIAGDLGIVTGGDKCQKPSKPQSLRVALEHAGSVAELADDA